MATQSLPTMATHAPPSVARMLGLNHGESGVGGGRALLAYLWKTATTKVDVSLRRSTAGNGKLTMAVETVKRYGL